MPLSRITARLTVEERDVPEMTEAILALIDSFIVQHKPVFHSEVCSQTADEVQNADEVRREIQSDIK